MIIVLAEVEEGVTASLAQRIENAIFREFPAAQTPLRLAHGTLGEEESVDEWLLGMGADACLTKPLDLAEAAETVEAP